MKTNDLQAGLKVFLENNPVLVNDLDKIVEEKTSVDTRFKTALHVSVEKKGRSGKIATFIDGLEEWTPQQVEELAAEMKKKLGTGGSCRENEILIQGNRRDDVVTFLKSKGFKTR